jgi:3-dehydroquinate synthase
MATRAKAPQSQFLTSLERVPLRSRNHPDLTILIYDNILEKVSEEFRSFLGLFPIRFGVDSGEKLKSIESFSSFCEKLSRSGFDLPPRKITVLAAGGGSLGDFAGFFASVYKRGVRLVHLPTTWLAAIDSAHGGKTALNIGGAKNQIGTFYTADSTVLVRSILLAQGSDRVFDAMGELAKIALIDGGSWVSRLESSPLIDADLLWKFLKPAIESKMKVVRRDPREEKGLRQVLNLGHTLGHVLESEMQMSHGAAVAQGLFFALEFSHQKRFLKDAAFERAMCLMAQLGLAPHPPAQALSDMALTRRLLQDKKRDSQGEVTFIFLREVGRCERRSVPVSEIVAEARRQGWAQ